jgi:hypothetical protein
VANADPIAAAALADARADMVAATRSSRIEFALVSQLSGQDGLATAMAFSADGKRLIIATSEGCCSVHDVASGNLIGQCEKSFDERPKPNTYAVALSADGKTGFVGGSFPHVYSFDAETGKLVRTFDRVGDKTTQLELSPSGSHLFIRESDQTARRVRLADGVGGHVSHNEGHPINSMAVVDDRTIALSFSKQPIAQLIVFPDREDEKVLGQEFENDSAVYRVAFGSRTLAMVRAGGTVRCLHRYDKRFTEDGNMHFSTRPTTWISGSHAFSDDDRFLVLLGQSGVLEVHDLHVAADPFRNRIQYSVPVPALASDGRTVATQAERGPVAIRRLSDLPANSEIRSARLILRYLTDERFELLDALGSLVAGDSRPLPWDTGRTYYEYLVARLSDTPGRLNWPSVDEIVAKWLRQRPGSRLARVLQAQQHVRRAWQARGNGFASTVTEEGWKKFEAELASAEAILVPLVKAPDCPLHAYVLLFHVAKGQGWPRAQVDDYVDALMKLRPDCWDAHRARAAMLLPRWQGEAGDAERYARWVAERVAGDEGKIQYARIAYSIHHYCGADEFYNSENFDYDLMMEGFDMLLERAPHDPYVLGAAMSVAYSKNDMAACQKYVVATSKYDVPYYSTDLSHSRFHQIRAEALKNPTVIHSKPPAAPPAAAPPKAPAASP